MSTQTAISASLLRGGTSKGLYFLAEDLPADILTRDRDVYKRQAYPSLSGLN